MTTRFVIRMVRRDGDPSVVQYSAGWRDEVDCRRRQRYVYCFETAADAVRLMGSPTFRRSIELADPRQVIVGRTATPLRVTSTDTLCHMGPEDVG